MTSADKCPDCQASVGDEHHEFCDVARCKTDGGQRLACMFMRDEDDDHDCGEDVWTGQWPGEVAIIA